jgi:hypothetical protein
MSQAPQMADAQVANSRLRVKPEEDSSLRDGGPKTAFQGFESRYIVTICVNIGCN